MAHQMRAWQGTTQPHPTQVPQPVQPACRPSMMSRRGANGRSQLTVGQAASGAASLLSPGKPNPWATASPAYVAHKAQTLGFGFSAGGLLFPFYVGLVHGLRQAGALSETTPVAGASAGSLIAACAKLGLTHDELTLATLELAAECRRVGTRHNLGPVLFKQLSKMLPDDAHERATAGRVHVAVTRVQPKIEPLLVSRFETREDLIQALMTSCHIPWYFNGKLTTDFRGELHCDGGLTNFLPSPRGVTHSVRVCCFPKKQLKKSLGPLCITPDMYDPDWPHDFRTMLNWAFHPADDATLLMLLEQGEKAALQWAAAEGILEKQQEDTQPAIVLS